MARDEDDATTDETVEAEAVTPEPVTPDAGDADADEAAAAPAAEPASTPASMPAKTSGRAPIDRRSLGIGAAGVAALVLAFIAGAAVGGNDHRDERIAAVRGERMLGAPGGGDGPRFEIRNHGGPGEMGERRRGGFGGPGGGGPRGMLGGHGGAGVVEAVSDEELTIAPLAGGIEELTVNLDDDTRVAMRGDDGPRDIEEADVDDIDEGDIVMVLGAPGDIGDIDDGDAESGDDEADDVSATIDAKAVIILRDGSE